MGKRFELLYTELENLKYLLVARTTEMLCTLSEKQSQEGPISRSVL